MILLLDLVFISKTSNPVADQGPEETQTKSSQQEPTLYISETTGSNRSDITIDIEH